MTIALVDMDGTLCDLAGAMSRELALLAAPGEPQASEVSPWIRARQRLIKRQTGFWRNLDRLPLGFAIVDLLRALDLEIHVLTKGPKEAPNAWAEKLEWIQHHLPDVRTTVTSDKSLVYGRVLVDDWPAYIEGWMAHRPRGLVVMPDQPWNRDFEHPRVVRATFEGLPEVELALRGAIGR